MATPVIQTSGSTSGAGTTGVDNPHLIIGETVTFSDTNGANSGHAYVWTLTAKPVGSAATLASPTTATPTLVPDVTGTYRVRAVVDTVDTAFRAASVALSSTGARIPHFDEGATWNFAGNAEGWHEALTYFMRQSDAILASVGHVGIGWAANEVAALTTLAGISTDTCSIFGGEQIDAAHWAKTGTWSIPATAVRGGAIQNNTAGATSLLLGDATGTQHPTKLGGAGYPWGMSTVFALQAAAAPVAFFLLSMSTNASAAASQGIQIGYHQAVDTNKFIAYVNDGIGTTSFSSTVNVSTAFHTARLWYNATTNKYFFSVDNETAIEITSLRTLTQSTTCTILVATDSGGTMKPMVLNRWIMVTGSEV